MATGLPWEYFAGQDDEIIVTYGDVLRSIYEGRSSDRDPGIRQDRRVFAEG